MHVTAKSDYALRAAIELAASGGETRSVAELAEAQDIPARFLENILLALRRAGIVVSRRGSQGGFRLARPATEITIADVLRAIDGPLANVQGTAPEEVRYNGSAAALRDVWVATRASLRVVLEHVTLADIAAARLPRAVQRLVSDPDAWDRRGA